MSADPPPLGESLPVVFFVTLLQSIPARARSARIERTAVPFKIGVNPGRSPIDAPVFASSTNTQTARTDRNIRERD